VRLDGKVKKDSFKKSSFKNNNYLKIIPVISILVFIFFFNFISIKHKSITYDEPNHFKYGLHVFKGNTDRFDDSKMPISVLNAVIYHIAKQLSPTTFKTPLHHFWIPRSVTIFFSMMLGLVVFFWTYEVYGYYAGLFSLFLIAFAPNIQAHARLVTTDLYSAFGITLAVYLFWRFLDKPGFMRGLLSAISLGVVQLFKFSMVFIYPIYFLILLFEIPRLRHIVNELNGNERYRRFYLIFCWLILFLITNIFIINAGYLFNGTGTPLADYSFRSGLFKALQKGLSFFSNLPFPLPRPYVEGLDWVRYNEITGCYRGPAYLLGITRTSPFFPFYFCIVFLLKIPIPILLLSITACLMRFFQPFEKDVLRAERFFIIPLGFFLIYFFFFSYAQMGIRMMLPALPFLYILCGKFYHKNLRSRKTTLISCFAALYLVISVSSYYPHLISYFNEFMFKRINAYQYLADSNLDWGQNEWYANEYLKKHPEVRKNPKVPTLGKVIISANSLVGITYGPPLCWNRWAHKNLIPVGHVAYSYLIFEISENELLRLNQWLKEKNKLVDCR